MKALWDDLKGVLALLGAVVAVLWFRRRSRAHHAAEQEAARKQHRDKARKHREASEELGRRATEAKQREAEILADLEDQSHDQKDLRTWYDRTRARRERDRLRDNGAD